MTNKELSVIINNIIELNQQYYNDEVSTKKLLINLDKEMKEMTTEDLLTIKYALTSIIDNK